MCGCGFFVCLFVFLLFTFKKKCKSSELPGANYGSIFFYVLIMVVFDFKNSDISFIKSLLIPSLCEEVSVMLV